MTLPESILAHEKEIVVTGSQIFQAMIDIREQGGWIPRMECKGCTYTLHIVWTEKKVEQGELI